MVIVLFGPDSYRRALKARELVAAYRAKHPLADLLAVDLEDDPDSWRTARDFLKQPSMFTDSKVLVVREPAVAEEKSWIGALEAIVAAQGAVAILSSEKDPANTFRFLDSREVERQEFKELDGRILEMFVAREAKARGIVLSAGALRFFLAHLEAFPLRSARARTELDLIRMTGFPLPVLEEHLARLTAWLPSREIYAGARAIFGEASPLARLAALERLLVDGEPAAKIFNFLGYLASGAPAAALAGYDVAVKSGKLEYEEALTDFAMSLSVGRSNATGSSAVSRAETFLQDAI
ncbi:MAG: hypothetical protein HYU81_01840 [Candidatus Brennerbacteria bacterium]|nr:hypothetical protein [Candidatus Brennerbacteria bacterium]